MPNKIKKLPTPHVFNSKFRDNRGKKIVLPSLNTDNVRTPKKFNEKNVRFSIEESSPTVKSPVE